jgi:hypothetical protein
MEEIIAQFPPIRYDGSSERRDSLNNVAVNKDQQLEYVKQRLSMFLQMLDALDPEQAELEDIDRLIEMIDELEAKVEQVKK